MNLVTFRQWTLSVDREATVQAYAATPKGGADTCACLYCENFAAAREQIYPADFRLLLEQLGVDYKKEAEVWEASPDKATLRLHSGWFHFVGAIVSVDEANIPERLILGGIDLGSAVREEPIGDSFAFAFSDRRDLCHPAFVGAAIVQLSFTALVPWVLNVEPDT